MSGVNMNGATLGAGRVVTVFGGSGFVRTLCARALARDGWRVRIACRRPDLAFHLQPQGRVGQVMAVQANLRHPESVAAALRGAVGRRQSCRHSGRGAGVRNSRSSRLQGRRVIAEAAKAAGIDNVVHISAIGADPNSASEYARSKAEGEAAVLAAVPTAVILRPSVIFGVEDEFFNRFATMARLISRSSRWSARRRSSSRSMSATSRTRSRSPSLAARRPERSMSWAARRRRASVSWSTMC